MIDPGHRGSVGVFVSGWPTLTRQPLSAALCIHLSFRSLGTILKVESALTRSHGHLANRAPFPRTSAGGIWACQTGSDPGTQTDTHGN